MTLNATNGILAWRPTVAQSPTTNLVSVMVADNGTPSLSATQQFHRLCFAAGSHRADGSRSFSTASSP